MDRGTKISAIGHGALILWVMLGDMLWPFDTLNQPEVANVSLMSEAEFAALQASAPKTDSAQNEPPPEPAAPKPAEPEPAEPEPAQEVPDVAPQPEEVPPPTAPLADVAQPIPVAPSDIAPAPRPMDRVAATPVNESPDTPDVADEATPEVAQEAPPDAQVIDTQQPAAAPQEAAPVVVTEADPAPEDAPQLAPTASARPKPRPAAPPKVDADAEAIAAALAEATADAAEQPSPQPSAEASAEASEPTSGGADLPEGPPMSGGEIEGLRIAINRCWVTSTLSTEAMNTTVTLRVEMSEAGKPTSIEMTDFSGGSRAAADRAFEAGRRAVIRCAGTAGYDLPAEKYGQWNVLNLIFDPNGMRLR